MTDTSKLLSTLSLRTKRSAGEQKKIVYSDKQIENTIRITSRIHFEMVKHFEQDNEAGYGVLAAMLQQLMDERDGARELIKRHEKKRIELVDLIHRAIAFLDSDDTEQWAVIYDCTESIPGFCFGQTKQKGDTG